MREVVVNFRIQTVGGAEQALQKIHPRLLNMFVDLKNKNDQIY